MKESSPKSEVQKIEEEMEIHGFPLEVEVSELLRSKEWNVSSKYYFIDEETDKPREIDCVAGKNSAFLEKKPPETSVETILSKGFQLLKLIIECKKSTKPWVFHTIESDVLHALFIKHIGELPTEKYKITGTGVTPIFPPPFLACLHLYTMKGVRMGLNHFEPFTEGKGSQISDALIKVIKALQYDKSILRDFAKKRKWTRALIIYYPLVVFEGNLYECKYERGERKISPVDHLYFDVRYYDETYRVEILKKELLPTFLAQLEHELRGLKEYFGSK